MKQKVFLLITGVFMSFNIANAQFAESNAVFVAGEFNVGNYFGADFSLNYVLNEKYSFKAGYSGNFRKPKSQPEDFTTGVTGILVFGLNHPVDLFENYSASFGRVYKINQEGSIRANLAIGPGYTVYTEPENWL